MTTPRFGRYLVLGELGAGGMGRVLRAEDPLLGRTVALKILPPELTGDAARRERLLREARASSALNHPNIVVVYDVGESDGQLYLTMELVDGVTLRVWSASPHSLAEIVDVGRQIALGLAVAHQASVVHRDVKPENVMVRADGLVKILDFGLAKSEAALPSVADDATQPPQSSAALIGTPEYLSPEQAQGRGSTARSDLFAFGAVMYELLAGRRAFGGVSLLEVLERIVRTEPEPLEALRPDLPSDLLRLVRELLDKDPAARPASAGEVADRLNDIARTLGARGTSVAELPTRPIAPKRRLRHKARPRTLALIVVALGVLATASFFIVRNLQQRSLPSSVAVLPLQNASAVPEDTDFLANGLSETLATQLTRLPGLRVTPWITSQRYAGDERPFAEIAAEMQVDALLVGTLKEVEGRLIATITLVDAKTGFQRWSEEFQRERADLLGVQRDIATDVATRLRGGLSGEIVDAVARPPAKSSEAYEHYLRATGLLANGDRESYVLAQGLFERALELDPDLVEAHVGVGAMYTARYYNAWGGGAENLVHAEEDFRRALALDPGSMNARRGLIRVHFQRGEDEICLRIGKEIADLGADDVHSLLARADAYQFGSLAKKAIPLYERVLALDPMNAGALALLMISRTMAGQFDLAIADGERYMQSFGRDADADVLQFMGIAYERNGELAKALEYFDEWLELTPEQMPAIRTYVLQALGRHAEARESLERTAIRIREQLDREPDNYWQACFLAITYGQMGRRQELESIEHRLVSEQAESGLVLAFLGRARTSLGDVETAQRFFRAALQLGHRYQIHTAFWQLDPVMRSRFDGVIREYEALGEKWAREY